MFGTSGVSFAVQSSFRTCIGPQTVMAYRSSNGESPVEACGTSPYASKTANKYMPQSLGFSGHISFSIILRTPFILSQSPLHFGFYGNVNNCLKDISLQTSFLRSEVNWLPLSPSISVENKPLRLRETKLQQLNPGKRNCLRVLCSIVYYHQDIFVSFG